ncbi:hypothetical protein PFISCL1PPCAC_11586, partial [Pristionchus fissidentatus]
MKFFLVFLNLAAIAIQVLAQDEGTVQYYYGLNNEAFNAIVKGGRTAGYLNTTTRNFRLLTVKQRSRVCCSSSFNEKFTALSPEAREFESNVEAEFDRCEQDSNCTQLRSSNQSSPLQRSLHCSRGSWQKQTEKVRWFPSHLMLCKFHGVQG